MKSKIRLDPDAQVYVESTAKPPFPFQLGAEKGRLALDEAQSELIAGHNRDEFRLIVVLRDQLGKISADQAALALRVFGPGPDGEPAYREAFPHASAQTLYELVQSDWGYRMPTLHLAQALAIPVFILAVAASWMLARASG